MANKQKRNNKPKNNTQLDNNAITKPLSSEELQHIIANALAEAETLKQTKETELRENEKKEWAIAESEIVHCQANGIGNLCG